MGEGRAEGSSATGDGGQAEVSLTPDADGTHICIFESLQLEGSYVGDLLCLPQPQKLVVHLNHSITRIILRETASEYTQVIKETDPQVEQVRNKRCQHLNSFLWQPSERCHQTPVHTSLHPLFPLYPVLPEHVLCARLCQGSKGQGPKT